MGYFGCFVAVLGFCVALSTFGCLGCYCRDLGFGFWICFGFEFVVFGYLGFGGVGWVRFGVGCVS